MTKDEKWLLEEKYKGAATEEFEADKVRLAAGEPVACVIGSQPFLGLNIYLDSHPLIPRVETEWWTEQLLKEITKNPEHSIEERTERDDASQSNFSTEKYAVPKVSVPVSSFSFLDLCAGSGAIGCAALARLPHAHVYFGEIDPAHEATIQKDIRENNLDASRADIRIGDLFEPFAGMKFDIIATNPPYVPSERVLETSVADYEPSIALYSGPDGLELIRRIAIKLPEYLAPGGQAWIECDSAHAAAACALFADHGLSVEIHNDQYDEPRILVVYF